MDVERWKRSAKAALDLIETGLYSLDPADKSNNITSPEVVLLRMNSDDNTFELRNFPIRFTEGRRTTAATGTFPTQELVDAFQTKNGYPVTLGVNGWQCDDPQFNAQTPYANRDLRFARTILANGSQFKGSMIETYVGGSDYASIAEGGSPTGYFLRKYIQESTDLNPNTPVSNKHHWIVYRYAETLLTYAESMVEAFGDPDYTDETYPYSARWAINQVRANVGMPDITVTGKTDFIAALRNEWRVEFAFEDHRFWDVRRWKIGDATSAASTAWRLPARGASIRSVGKSANSGHGPTGCISIRSPSRNSTKIRISLRKIRAGNGPQAKQYEKNQTTYYDYENSKIHAVIPVNDRYRSCGRVRRLPGKYGGYAGRNPAETRYGRPKYVCR